MRRLFQIIWALRRRLAPTSPVLPALSRAPEGVRAQEWSSTRAEGDESVGYGYVERWRRSERMIIKAQGESGTSLRLFSENAPDTPPATHPHVMAEARNLVLDFGRIGRR